MRRIAGFAVALAGYGLMWFAYEAITGRVAGTPTNNGWLPSLKDQFIPGRLAAPRLASSGSQLQDYGSGAQSITPGVGPQQNSTYSLSPNKTPSTGGPSSFSTPPAFPS